MSFLLIKVMYAIGVIVFVFFLDCGIKKISGQTHGK